MKIDVVDWIEDARRCSDGDTITFPHVGPHAWMYRTDEYVSEFGAGRGGRRLERVFVAGDAARIGMEDTGGNLVGMKRSPTTACCAYFREGRG
jgi:hypothetical protein